MDEFDDAETYSCAEQLGEIVYDEWKWVVCDEGQSLGIGWVGGYNVYCD